MERKMSVTKKLSTRKITTFAMLTAITVILGFTPLGIIPIPPVSATIMHIPVIIIAILEGPIAGALMGLIFGLISIIRAITTGNLLLMAFLNPLVSVLPRVFIGIAAYYSYKLLPVKNESIRVGVAAAVGTFINTVGFLGMMYLLYAGTFAKVNNIKESLVGDTILTIAVTHGIPEILVAVVITTSVVIAVKKIMKN